MGKTSIEWTDAQMVDRDGRRVRKYTRQDPTRPGQQLRRQMALVGLRWCRGCSAWLPQDNVTRQGACRPCTNAEYRARYAADGQAIRARVHARKRGVLPVPSIAAEVLTENFAGKCAYCPAPATTWDHIHPVSLGGDTVPGNLVPACSPCNSSKKSSNVLDWCEKTGRDPFGVIEVLLLSEVL
ncbi:HNH endonuclease [Nocardia rhizosphaerae]|uniref:HNH endonuclease n=1 Tax=Nocardia rhizosphaerae TaxID=1691571 RepID=A0ABV8LDA6_9NOCA